MKDLVAAQPGALCIHFNSKVMHGEQVTLVENITYATDFAQYSGVAMEFMCH